MKQIVECQMSEFWEQLEPPSGWWSMQHVDGFTLTSTHEHDLMTTHIMAGQYYVYSLDMMWDIHQMELHKHCGWVPIMIASDTTHWWCRYDHSDDGGFTRPTPWLFHDLTIIQTDNWSTLSTVISIAQSHHQWYSWEHNTDLGTCIVSKSSQPILSHR